MDTVITRIIEIEKESARSIENAALASRRKIEAYQRTLEEKKAKAFAEILAAQNARLENARKTLHQRIDRETLALQSQFEKLFHNPQLIQKVKEKIKALLLSE